MPRPWDTARKHYTLADNGLNHAWTGRVWLNPPYGAQTRLWMARLAQEGNGIALIFARTETATFFPWVWEYATGLLFLKGRLSFFTKEGRQGGVAGAPSVLIAYGEENFSILERAPIPGRLLRLNSPLTPHASPLTAPEAAQP